MPGLGTTQTLADLAMNAGIKNDPIVEFLTKSTPLLEDMASDRATSLMDTSLDIEQDCRG